MLAVLEWRYSVKTGKCAKPVPIGDVVFGDVLQAPFTRLLSHYENVNNIVTFVICPITMSAILEWIKKIE